MPDEPKMVPKRKGKIYMLLGFVLCYLSWFENDNRCILISMSFHSGLTVFLITSVRCNKYSLKKTLKMRNKHFIEIFEYSFLILSGKNIYFEISYNPYNKIPGWSSLYAGAVNIIQTGKSRLSKPFAISYPKHY